MRLRLSVVFAAVLALSACGADQCGNDPVKTALAPGGARQAVLFERDCGATTGFSLQVSITEPGKQPRGPGTVFIADGDHGPLPKVDVRWISADELLVVYGANARIFRQERQVDGVAVRYEVTTPAA